MSILALHLELNIKKTVILMYFIQLVMICVLGKNMKTQYRLSMEIEVFQKNWKHTLELILKKVKETFEKN